MLSLFPHKFRPQIFPQLTVPASEYFFVFIALSISLSSLTVPSPPLYFLFDGLHVT